MDTYTQFLIRQLIQQLNELPFIPIYDHYGQGKYIEENILKRHDQGKQKAEIGEAIQMLKSGDATPEFISAIANLI